MKQFSVSDNMLSGVVPTLAMPMFRLKALLTIGDFVGGL